MLYVYLRIILMMLTQPHQDLKEHNRKSDCPVHPFFLDLIHNCVSSQIHLVHSSTAGV